MAYAFDTLSYSKTLRAAGIPTEHAEAHAAAAREFIMVDLVTKEDLRATKDELRSAMELETLRLTIRLGSITAAGLVAMTGVLATLVKLL